MSDLSDVIIVGAGITGLMAAKRCQEAGLSVRVLEGRDRVGGRTLSRGESYDGGTAWFDFGAHFIGKDKAQSDVWDLVDELGLDVFKQYEGPEKSAPPPYWAGEGANLLSWWDSDPARIRTKAYVDAIMPESVVSLAVMAELKGLIFAMLESHPADFPYAAFYDNHSVKDWVAQTRIWGDPAPQEMHDLLNMLCRVGFSADYDRISMLWFLFYLKSSGGLDEFSNVRFPSQGAQGWRLKEGAQSISETLAARLTAADADALMLSRTVKAVDFSDTDRAAVHCADGSVHHGRRVLVALAPKLANRIAMTPDIPSGRRAAAAAMENGQTVMTCVRFKTPFWRTDTTRYPQGEVYGKPTQDISRYGLSGNALVIDGRIVWTMDNVSDEGAPAMFAFVVGDTAVNWHTLPEAKRQSIILHDLGILFGAQAVSDNFVSYDEKLWPQDPYSEGCPAGHFKPGSFLDGYQWVLLDHMPEFMDGRLHFASTEAATVSNGYMSGAVWAGKRVAQNILATL
jgi:monoamine oxidase